MSEERTLEIRQTYTSVIFLFPNMLDERNVPAIKTSVIYLIEI